MGSPNGKLEKSAGDAGQLLERASKRFSDGHYAEAVLLIYPQVDGMFQDRAADGEEAFSRPFSRRPVNSSAGEEAVQFADLVMGSRTIGATGREFYPRRTRPDERDRRFDHA